MPKCLMLDVDGVLVSGRPADGKVWTYSLLEDLGIDPQLLSEQFFHKEWKEIITGKRDLLPALSMCLDRNSITVSVEKLVSYWFEMDSRIVNSVLYDCRELREMGVSIFLTTNQEHRRVEYLMETLNLQAEVDGIIYSAQVGIQKPHPDFFECATQVTGCAPKNVILVDDTQKNVDGAKRAGWQAVHWKPGMRLVEILRCNIHP